LNEAVNKVTDDPKSTKDEVCVPTLRELTEKWDAIVSRDPTAEWGLLSQGLRELTKRWDAIVGRDPSAEGSDSEEEENLEDFFLPDGELARVLVVHLVQS
jgi:hypothetical protein